MYIDVSNQWCNKLHDKQRDATWLSWAWPSIFPYRIAWKYLWEMAWSLGSKWILVAITHLPFIFYLISPSLYHPCHHWIKVKVCTSINSFYGHAIHATVHVIGLRYCEYITIINTCITTYKMTHSPFKRISVKYWIDWFCFISVRYNIQKL